MLGDAVSREILEDQVAKDGIVQIVDRQTGICITQYPVRELLDLIRHRDQLHTLLYPPKRERQKRPEYPWKFRKNFAKPYAWDVVVDDVVIGTTHRVYRGNFLGYAWNDTNDREKSGWNNALFARTRDEAAEKFYERHFGKAWNA